MLLSVACQEVVYLTQILKDVQLEFVSVNIKRIVTETSKSQVLAGFTGFIARSTNPIEVGSLGFRTQLTQVVWVLEPGLPSLTGFIKTNKKLGFS